MAGASKDIGAIDCVLVASGKYHDIDFARLELLKLLAEDDRVRVRVFEDYSNLEAIRNAAFLITYTCDVVPSLEQQEAQWGSEVPLGRFGVPEDIATAVAFIASDRAGFIVGSNIDVDGGYQRSIL